MTAKITASADGTKVLIGTAAEDALQIDVTAKTITPVAPYSLNNPQLPAFDAQQTSGTPQGITTVGNFIGFTSVQVTSPYFDGPSGTFTAPVTGLYHFDWVVMGDGNSVIVTTSLAVDGGGRCQGSRSAATAFNGSSGSTTTRLDAGQQARIFVSASAAAATNDEPAAVRFSGYLVKAF